MAKASKYPSQKSRVLCKNKQGQFIVGAAPLAAKFHPKDTCSLFSSTLVVTFSSVPLVSPGVNSNPPLVPVPL